MCIMYIYIYEGDWYDDIIQSSLSGARVRTVRPFTTNLEERQVLISRELVQTYTHIQSLSNFNIEKLSLTFKHNLQYYARIQLRDYDDVSSCVL